MPAPVVALPFKPETSAVLSISPDDRPDGDILYAVRAMDSYQEQITHRDGSFQTIRVYIPWSVADDFVDFSIGYTRWVRTDPTRFNRVLPMASPFTSDNPESRPHYAESCQMVQYGTFGSSKLEPDSNANKWPLADWCEYDITFRPRLYDMLTDEQVDSSDYPWAGFGGVEFAAAKEMGRYLQRIPRSVSEELQIGQYLLETDEASPKALPTKGFIPNNYTEWTYIWYNVPEDAVPHDAIAACQLRVNDNPFDYKRDIAGTGWTTRFPAGTLLFKGLGQELTPYVGPRGEPLVDVTYLFKFQSQGHNSVSTGDPDAAWVPIRRKGINKPVYGSADFRTLFKPRAS